MLVRHAIPGAETVPVNPRGRPSTSGPPA